MKDKNKKEIQIHLDMMEISLGTIANAISRINHIIDPVLISGNDTCLSITKIEENHGK